MATPVNSRYFDSSGMQFASFRAESISEAKNVGKQIGAYGMIVSKTKWESEMKSPRFFVVAGTMGYFYEKDRDAWIDWNCELSANKIAQAVNHLTASGIGEE